MKVPKLEETGSEHSHPELDREIDPYPTHHPDVMSDTHGGDICPRCGEALTYTDIGVTLDGDVDMVRYLAPEDVTVPIWHLDCKEERDAEITGQISSDLEDFMG